MPCLLEWAFTFFLCQQQNTQFTNKSTNPKYNIKNVNIFFFFVLKYLHIRTHLILNNQISLLVVFLTLNVAQCWLKISYIQNFSPPKKLRFSFAYIEHKFIIIFRSTVNKRQCSFIPNLPIQAGAGGTATLASTFYLSIFWSEPMSPWTTGSLFLSYFGNHHHFPYDF